MEFFDNLNLNWKITLNVLSFVVIFMKALIKPLPDLNIANKPEYRIWLFGQTQSMSELTTKWHDALCGCVELRRDVQTQFRWWLRYVLFFLLQTSTDAKTSNCVIWLFFLFARMFHSSMEVRKQFFFGLSTTVHIAELTRRKAAVYFKCCLLKKEIQLS